METENSQSNDTPVRRTLRPEAALSLLTAHILEMEAGSRERLAIGIAGGPGSGKSTLASELMTMLDAVRPRSAALVPMDGFHMRHAKLEKLGLVDFKGAPHTFEGAEFAGFLHHIKHAKIAVSGPGYSRKIEDVVENAYTVRPDVRVLIVEGNYLLLSEGAWAGVKPQLDFSVFIDVPRETVRARLLKRHAEEGLFSEERNKAHIERTDLPNYDLVAQSQDRADLIITIDSAH
ncbi:nucleoside/nucleotide kinase family protein [Devosia rhodophyticola]|uniref:Nucleoside/nucleotide kinase family protein n=1 Tax=Devosia rhodophyticola TaxID=3026423 RepID=A0ABY7Z0R2_9HYPH|nr:nucleoside/nucleotide kinase family protein [Devosia rhodophyticola]WDR07067.1 nucleoside/nucleotide kinase family protein [Devosia rhodophyticola]